MKKILLFIGCIIAPILADAQTPSLQWAKNMGGSTNDLGSSISVDVSGNVYTTGYFTGTVDFDPGAGTFNLTSTGGNDIFVSKLDASGNFVWAKQIGGALDEAGVSIAVDASGNIYTTGNFQGTVDFDPGAAIANLTSAGGTDIFILKLDASGNFVWAKNMGGSLSDEGWSIAVDGSGNVYTTGSFNGTADFDPNAGTYNLTSAGFWDIFISKLDASGTFVWAKRIGDTAQDRSFSIVLDASDNVYTTGYFHGTVDFDPNAAIFNLTSVGGSDIFISALDVNGNFVWAKQMGGTLDDEGDGIAVDVVNNIYIAGIFSGTSDFDPDVTTFNLTSAGGYDVFISELNGFGDLMFAKNIGGATDDYLGSIAVDASSNIYTTGSFTTTADFDPNAGTFNLTSVGSSDVFISKLDDLGNFVWASNIGSALYDSGGDIAVDASDNIYTTGLFQTTADFDPTSGTFNLTSNGGYDIFVQKLGSTTTGIKENAIENRIAIYPNPTNGAFNITVSAPTSNAIVYLYNSLGALIFSKQTENTQTNIELTDQSNGIYFVKVMSDDKIIAEQKIIKQ